MTSSFHNNNNNSNRQLVYCQQQQHNQQAFVPVLEQFLIKYPQWQRHLAVAYVTSPSSSSPSKPYDTTLIEKTVPFLQQAQPDPSLMTLANICILIMKPDAQQKWLKDTYCLRQRDTNGNNTLKHVILIDPSAKLLPPSPPLLPIDQYKVITIPHVDDIPPVLHSILSQLISNTKMTKAPVPSYPKPLESHQVIQAYQTSRKRLFLFDYDGTLTPIVSRPEMALPTDVLLEYLATLCNDPMNIVWIISGRDQKFLHRCFGHLNGLGLSAEHGSFMKMPGESTWVDMLKDAVLPWKRQALDIFTTFTDQLPGTEVEVKKSSITWHYRNAHDQQDALEKSHECHQALLGLPGVDILVGKMNLEVRSVLVNKGNVVKRIRQQGDAADFVICAGDDQTDEDMFKALFYDTMAYTLLVGPTTKLTLARACVDTSQDVVDLLGHLIHHSSPLPSRNPSSL